MSTLIDLFDSMTKRERLDDFKLGPINIGTNLNYQFLKVEDKNYFRLEDKYYLLHPKASLYVDGDEVYIDNKIATPDMTIYDDVQSVEESSDVTSEGNAIAVERIKTHVLDITKTTFSGLEMIEKKIAVSDDRIDKRNVIYRCVIKDRSGNLLYARVYKTKSQKEIRGYIRYGEIEIYTNDEDIRDDGILAMVNYLISLNSKINYKRPFYDGDYIYVLGDRKEITSDIRFKSDDTYFYVEKKRHPIEKYKKMFFLYLSNRLVELGKMMNKDLSSDLIKIGSYGSFFACNCPAKRYFKFDYRNFAYRKDILDALIIHEIAHCYVLPHNRAFYSICTKYCKDYYALDNMIDLGYFNDDLSAR